jgi:hypothetical protein
MLIAEFSLIHHIMGLLQVYLMLGKVFGCFWLKLDKLDSYRTFCNAWRCALDYTIRCRKLHCEIHCELDDTVNSTRFVANSYFDGLKRINGHQMARGAWYNYWRSVKARGYLEKKEMRSKDTSLCKIKVLG